MSLFSDIFRAIGVLFLGLKDRTKMYSEAVENAERYNRWGEQRNDIRDYNTALTHCQKCNDNDAPKFDMRLRRYIAQAEAYCGLVRCECRLYEERNQKGIARIAGLEAEIADLEARKKEQQDYVQSLKDDGSLIKAKEAQGRVDEIDRTLERHTELLTSGSMEKELQQEFNNLLQVSNRHHSEFDGCLGAIRTIEGAEAHLQEDTIDRLRMEMEQQISKVHSLEPGAGS
ncbi:MAG: hypothetical protein ACYTGH_17190 [Planctomycetota bacterium]|jgi:translation initiation factor 2 beta subunit (eIF-2beta)/eIF-5